MPSTNKLENPQVSTSDPATRSSSALHRVSWPPLMWSNMNFCRIRCWYDDCERLTTVLNKAEVPLLARGCCIGVALMIIYFSVAGNA
jgi:hypothetical protein